MNSGSTRNPDPETKILDFVERWIKFALCKINLLSVFNENMGLFKDLYHKLVCHWRYNEKLPAQDTSFEK